MVDVNDVLGIFLVPLLWGITNPLIRKGSEGLKDIHGTSKLDQFKKEAFSLLSNWKYLLPFAVNQLGSVAFYILLASSDVSLVVPLCNSLTFIVTILMGSFLGEQISKDTLIGMVFVISGVSLCLVGCATTD